MPDFLGLPCVELKNEALSMLITTTVGTRILSLRIHGGENLFAEVPDMTLDCPGAGKFHFWGGHRFWVAPENPRTTYLPDDQPVKIETMKPGLKITQATQTLTGLQKSMTVMLGAKTVGIDHVLTNRGTEPVLCAPWSITQFKPGGFAILGPHRLRTSQERLLPDRRFSLWPYTDIRSCFIKWGNKFTFVHARLKSGALKIGYEGSSSGYFRRGTLFLKESMIQGRLSRCSIECYCNDRFIELESSAPVANLQPGESLKLWESWSVFDKVKLQATESSMKAEGFDLLIEASLA